MVLIYFYRANAFKKSHRFQESGETLTVVLLTGFRHELRELAQI